MTTRTTLALGLATALVILSSDAKAQQRTNFGQQVQQQLLNDVSSRITGQPAYPYQNQAYAPYQNQAYSPYQNQGTLPYQVRRPVYGQPGNSQQGTLLNRLAPGLAQQGASQRYQLPPQYAGYAPGSTLSYGGRNYTVNADRTMSPAAATNPAVLPAPAGQRYQIPGQYAGAAPGSTVTYGGRSYAINSDGTMSPVAR